jgi:hypothetical protein
MGTVMTHQTERPLQLLTKVASGVVENRRFVLATGAQCTVAGSRAQGVSHEYAADTKSFALAVEGTTLVMTGGAITVGANVTTDVDGKAVVAVATNHINGIALAAQSEVGQLVEIQLLTSNEVVA